MYDRITIFEDHLTRDMLMGRFTDSSVVLVTHGLTMRLFLMRWFHWSVEEMLRVFNPGNAIVSMGMCGGNVRGSVRIWQAGGVHSFWGLSCCLLYCPCSSSSTRLSEASHDIARPA